MCVSKVCEARMMDHGKTPLILRGDPCVATGHKKGVKDPLRDVFDIAPFYHTFLGKVSFKNESGWAIIVPTQLYALIKYRLGSSKIILRLL